MRRERMRFACWLLFVLTLYGLDTPRGASAQTTTAKPAAVGDSTAKLSAAWKGYGLPEGLASADEKTRSAAIDGLRGQADAVVKLLKALDDDERAIRFAAGEALLIVAPTVPSTAKLIAVGIYDYEGAHLEFPRYGRRALARIGKPAFPHVLKWLEIGDPVLMATVEPGDTDAIKLLVEFLVRIDREATEESDNTFLDLIESVDTDAAAKAFLILGADASAAAIAKQLDDRARSHWLFAALTQIANRDTPSATGALVRQLASEDSARAFEAAEALARIGKPAVPALAAALSDGKRRLYALQALIAMRSQAAGAVEAILPLVKCKDAIDDPRFWDHRQDSCGHIEERTYKVSDFAWETLAAIGPAAAKALPTLLDEEAKRADSNPVACSIHWAHRLGRAGKPLAAALATELSAESTSARIDKACDELAKTDEGRKRTRTENRAIARTEDLKRRVVAVNAWSHITPDDDELVERFFALLWESNLAIDEPGCFGEWPFLGDLAPVALASPAKFKPQLLRMVTESGEGRAKALFLLGCLGSEAPEAQAALFAGLNDKDIRTRQATISGMSRGGHKSSEAAVAFVERIVHDAAYESDYSGAVYAKAALSQFGTLPPLARESLLRAWRSAAKVTSDDDGLRAEEMLSLLLRLGVADDAILDEAVRRLKSDDAETRCRAAHYLGQIQSQPKRALLALELAARAARRRHEIGDSSGELLMDRAPSFDGDNGAWRFSDDLAAYLHAIGRYGPSAAAYVKLLLSIAVGPVDSSSESDGGAAFGDGASVVESLVALARIGPAAKDALQPLRTALANSELDETPPGVRLAASVAILKIDGRDQLSDVMTVEESLRFACHDEISKSLADELGILGSKHRTLVPRMELLFRAAFREVSLREDNFLRTAIRPFNLKHSIRLGEMLNAADAGNRAAYEAFEGALKRELGEANIDRDYVKELIAALSRIKDRTPEFRDMLKPVTAHRDPRLRRAAADVPANWESPKR